MLNRFTPLVAALVPSAPGLRVDEVRQTDTGIVIAMTSTHATAHCPRCRSASRRVRSCYQRTLADLPWSSCVITLLLTVRKFACDVAACPQRIFVERLPTVTVPYARRTNRLTDVVRAIAFATGGAGGQRLLERIGMPGSGTTLLRLIRRTPVLAGHTPRVLGIDDWARRKGQTYGTILVDLERHRPVDLLPERDATLVARWLQAHPGVKIISRDRGSTYVDGATLGVPDAVQVADRWHLLHNLADALERVLTAHRAQIRHVLQPAGAQRPLDAAAARVQQIGPPARSARAQEEIDTRRTMRLARYETVLALRERGMTLRTIALQVGLNAKTVQRWLATDRFPELPVRHMRRSLLEPYKPFLLKRWASGCHNGTRLYTELVTQGYSGGRTTVRDFLARLRPPRTRPGTVDPGHTGQASTTVAPSVPTVRQLVWYVLRRNDRTTDDERAAVARLRTAHVDVDQAVAFAQAFAEMVRQRQPEQLEPWLWRVANSQVGALRSFAAGIQRDKPAVLAGLTLEWSQGQTEGQITRLKLLKRSGYGRAKFDLLRQRVLYRS